MPSQPFLSVIVPAFNEQNNLKRPVLDEIVAYLQKQPYEWELILSDDGSLDGTVDVFKKFAKNNENVRVIENPHRGKGPTVTSGMLEARGKWRLFTDFDQSTPLKEVEKLFKYQDEFEILIGSREIEGALRDKEPFYRHLMGRGFNLVVQLLAVPGFKDTQCGFKMFSDVATEVLFPKLYIYGSQNEQKGAFTGAFDVELLFLAKKHDFKVREVPILWKHYETDRVNPIKDSWRMFQDIVRIRVADANGKYSLE